MIIYQTESRYTINMLRAFEPKASNNMIDDRNEFEEVRRIRNA